jgi:predicted small secreted protein
MKANVSRVFILAAVVVAALVTSSCNDSYGVGMGMDYGARWGGGAAGPPIFVGGPTR